MCERFRLVFTGYKMDSANLHLKETCKQLFTIWHCFILCRMSQVDCLDVSLGILILNVCTLGLAFLSLSHQFYKATMHALNKHHTHHWLIMCYTEWTTEGCQTAVNGDVVTCTCNHLTNFAILVVSISFPVHLCVHLFSIASGQLNT